MTRYHRALYALMLLLAAAVFPPRAAAGEPLHVGVAEADITPPLGFPIAGYYHERLATGTLDPLKAKAVVFRSGKTQAALVVCDLTGIAVDLGNEVRHRAAAKTGIPAEHIVVSATHSHTAPDFTRDLFEHLADKPGKGGQPRYAARLIDGVVEAIVNAQAALKPAMVEAGAVRQETPVSFNRRFVMRDGTVKTWMRLDHPDVVRPAGPIDPEIGMLLVRGGDKKPLGLVSNFALHLDTVGGTQWSGDYPHFIGKEVRKALGENVASIFGTGCCGDINHVDPVRKERNKTDYIGGELGKTITSHLGKLRPVKDATLRVRHTTVKLPLQKVSAAQLSKARPLLLEARAGKKVEFFDLVNAYKAVMLDQLRNKRPESNPSETINWGLTHAWAGVGEHLPVDVQAIAVGDEVAIVCLPGEIFVELGLAIKQASPFRTTLVIELSNCVETVYVPTRAAYAGGSYEVTNSTVEPGSGEMLVEAALRLLGEMAREGSE
jgi:neutral ceramidase